MVRTPALVGLAVLALLLASGTGAAQTLSGSAYASGSASAAQPLDGQVETANSNDLSMSYEGEAYVDATAEAEMILELVPPIALDLPQGDAPEVPADLGDAPAEPEPAPVPEPEPQPAPEPQPLPIDDGDDIVASYEGGGSIDGSVEGGAYVGGEEYVGHEEIPAEPAPAPEPLPEPQPEPQPAPEQELPAEVDLADSVESYVDGSVLYGPFREEPSPGPQVTPTLDTDDGFSFGFDLSAALHLATDGFSAAAHGVSLAVDEIVDGVKAAVDGIIGSQTDAAVSTATHVQALTEIEAVGELTGDVDLVGSLTGDVLPSGELDAELPTMAMPAPAVDATADASSETSISSSLTGDLGVGLP